MAFYRMKKQERKLMNLQEEAESCLSRKEAHKILNKEKKARAKLYVKRILEDV